jgi:Ca-activated chloride channel homolog
MDLKGRNEELVSELVGLSTRHGILTPYTSFLADENTSLFHTAANEAEAGRRLGALDQAEGRGGFAQRRFKGSLQRAAQGAPAGATERLREESFQFGAGGGGAPAARLGAKKRTASPASSPAGASLAGDSDKLADETESLRNIGAKSFYRRDNRWVDSTLTEAQEKNAQHIKQFSDEYFKLAEQHGRKLSQYLAFDEPVFLNLDGQAYLIEPPETTEN